MMGLFFSAVALAAHADDEPNKRQTQQGHIHRRKRRRRQLLETKQFIESAQNLTSSPLRSAAATQTQSSSQSIRRTESQPTHSSAGKTPLQSQQPQARHFDNVCERAAQAYVAEGGNCSCVHDPISDEVVTLDCHFPACEECVTLGRTDLCARISTHFTLSDVGSNNGGKPAEVSYTECFTYTKGRSGDTLCYTEFMNPQGGLFEDCFLDVNGVFCDSCRTDSCEGSQVAGLSQLDCSNVNGGSRWDFCESGGVFDPPVAANSVFLAFADPGVFYFDMCSRDPILAWTPFFEHDGNVDYTKTFDYPPVRLAKESMGKILSFSTPCLRLKLFIHRPRPVSTHRTQHRRGIRTMCLRQRIKGSEETYSRVVAWDRTK